MRRQRSDIERALAAARRVLIFREKMTGESFTPNELAAGALLELNHAGVQVTDDLALDVINMVGAVPEAKH